jgi:hypothetical protein
VIINRTGIHPHATLAAMSSRRTQLMTMKLATTPSATRLTGCVRPRSSTSVTTRRPRGATARPAQADNEDLVRSQDRVLARVADTADVVVTLLVVGVACIGGVLALGVR